MGRSKQNLFAAILLVRFIAGAELPDLRTVPPDLETPRLLSVEPAPGIRVRQTTTGYPAHKLYHALYLPTNWQPNRRFPVIVEYAGNGNYTNRFGDVSSGTVEGSNMGYGVSGGSNYLWICMPFVRTTGAGLENCPTWWGDLGETLAYCTNTVRYVCKAFGGDTNAIILAGFSRGSIACNYIGLNNDTIAPLWRAFICYSHYDGVRTNWPYAGADHASALTRLRRLRGRPQFICQEISTLATEMYLKATGVPGSFTFQTIPFRNHSDAWLLRDNTARGALREWLKHNGLP